MHFERLIRRPCFVTIGSAGLRLYEAIAKVVLKGPTYGPGEWSHEFNMGGHIHRLLSSQDAV